MKSIPVFQVDAFADGPFTGNPAAVCLSGDWLPGDVMQKIAAENNLAETAFIVPDGTDYKIRWFTPLVEVDLCGHATLASGFVVLNNLNPGAKEVIFHSLYSGSLSVSHKGDMLELNFPTDTLTRCQLPELIKKSLDINPVECFTGRSDYLVMLKNEAEVLNVRPDFRRLASADSRGVIVTAKGNDVDFVSRFFAPQAGIDEDPVTGSAHTTLTPFWSSRLGKTTMTARQLSARGGYLECTLKGDRTLIAGRAVLYLKGVIYV
ncbi:MAG TPA: PhzF family phenazine biosynthesis protein [Bacteroidales bacterium]|nr:PhzF family phenazine biosynthesis protein [Bacteroidales bacterium]